MTYLEFFALAREKLKPHFSDGFVDPSDFGVEVDMLLKTNVDGLTMAQKTVLICSATQCAMFDVEADPKSVLGVTFAVIAESLALAVFYLDHEEDADWPDELMGIDDDFAPIPTET